MNSKEENGSRESIFEKITQENLISLAYFDAEPSFSSLTAKAHQPSIQKKDAQKEALLESLIQVYRLKSHHIAHLNPLKKKESFSLLSSLDINPLEKIPDGFLEKNHLPSGIKNTKELEEHLQKVYASFLGLDVVGIEDDEKRNYLYALFEREALFQPQLALQKKLLESLVQADTFEEVLSKKFSGAKRFGLEGNDSLILLLNQLLESLALESMTDVVLSMQHRGRLNALVNVLGKPISHIFDEFMETHEETGTGDVKYHKGYQSKLKIQNHLIKLRLCNNPSHLEAVFPVALGLLRAIQDEKENPKKAIGIHIHGDASFVGQGVVMESFQTMRIPGYKTLGNIHIILDNQIGFTLDEPKKARSTQTPADLVRGFSIPVIHVNADEPESVMAAAKIAISYRQKFFEDIVIHHVGYRRNGHNEADDPSLIAPLLYQKIKKTPKAFQLYEKKLLDLGRIELKTSSQMKQSYQEACEKKTSLVPCFVSDFQDELWQPFYQNNAYQPFLKTSLKKEDIQKAGASLVSCPKGFSLHRLAEKTLQKRKEMLLEKIPMDWAMGELLALNTLAFEGFSVRFSGQDSQRGTFGHRQAFLKDQKNGKTHALLPKSIFLEDAFLSEEGVLSFEYGYSLLSPKKLVIWEAQFGDFSNAAQVVFDQFISSAEQKWGQLSSLVCLLPHGLEGQGPEHSSARVERFLQLCAQENMQLIWPSVPSQVFHALRRQIHAPYKKPVVMITPKSLLRHPKAVSRLDDFSKGHFLPVLPDKKHKNAQNIILCSGKVYYDLLEARGEDSSLALIRLEQLYPFPKEALLMTLKQYPSLKNLRFVQEEPYNQGAYLECIRQEIELILASIQCHFSFVSGAPMVAASFGKQRRHLEGQRDLIKRALCFE